MTETRPNVWQLQSRHDVPGLIAALRHPDFEVRKRAAIALRVLDATEAVSALKSVLRDEPDDQVRQSVMAALQVLDQHVDIDALMAAGDLRGLIGVLNTRHAGNVIAAANALGDLGDRRAAEPLVILFHNSSSPPQVRLAAAEALLKLQSAPAVVTLLGALRRDSWQVRRNAAAVLGQLQAVWAVDPLAEALRDTHPVVRRTAAAALRRIGTADAISALHTHFSTGPLSQKSAPPPEPQRSPVPSSAQVTKERIIVPTAPDTSEPPYRADDTVPTHAVSAGESAGRPDGEQTERVTLGASADTQPSNAGPRQSGNNREKSPDPETPSLFRQSIRRLIDFLS